ncbi:MAG: hypothetical protein ACPLY9_02035 [Nitrososphaerales archaeon]
MKGANKTLAVIALTLIIAIAPLGALATPNPLNYQISIPFNPFYTTTPTWYDIETAKQTPVPWQAEVYNYLTYNMTGTKGASIRFTESRSTTDDAITLTFYNNGVLDIIYTDGVSGASNKIGTGTWSQGEPIYVVVNQQGKLYVYNSTKSFVSDFTLTTFTVSTIGASGNVDSGAGNNYVTTGGYVTVLLGGAITVQESINLVISLIPLVALVAVIGIVVGTIKGIGKKT